MTIATATKDRRMAKHKGNNPREDLGTHMPSEGEILDLCRKIREEGFTDERGEWHEPWGNFDERRNYTESTFRKKPRGK